MKQLKLGTTQADQNRHALNVHVSTLNVYYQVHASAQAPATARTEEDIEEAEAGNVDEGQDEGHLA